MYLSFYSFSLDNIDKDESKLHDGSDANHISNNSIDYHFLKDRWEFNIHIYFLSNIFKISSLIYLQQMFTANTKLILVMNVIVVHMVMESLLTTVINVSIAVWFSSHTIFAMLTVIHVRTKHVIHVLTQAISVICVQNAINSIVICVLKILNIVKFVIFIYVICAGTMISTITFMLKKINLNGCFIVRLKWKCRWIESNILKWPKPGEHHNLNNLCCINLLDIIS